MKKEIKEILDIFTTYKDDWFSCEYKLKPKQCVALYDYITNLQEDLEKVSGSHFEIFQENKILKEEIKTLYKYTPEKGFRLVGDKDVKD